MRKSLLVLSAFGLLAISSAHAFTEVPKACECVSDPNSKRYDESKTHKGMFGGETRTWTCEYTCATPRGEKQRVVGTQTGGYFFSERGDEFTCFGTVYETQDTPFDSRRMYSMFLVGASAFNAAHSEVGELKTWATQVGCSGR